MILVITPVITPTPMSTPLSQSLVTRPDVHAREIILVAGTPRGTFSAAAVPARTWICGVQCGHGSQDVEKLELVPKGDAKDLATGKPSEYTDRGLPSHLHVDIKGGQRRYK